MGLTRMRVEISMPIYEIDGSEPKGGDPHLIIESHWNRTSDFVVLVLGGHKYAVAVDAISKAINRATGF